MNIYFSDEESRLTDDMKTLMQEAAVKAFSGEFGDIPEGAEDMVCLSVTVTDGEEIRTLNNEYRGIDKTTDVLSFPQFVDPDEISEWLDEYDEESPELLLGDVVLCYDRALEQAEEYGTGITRECVYLFVHSVFHLLGYDHMEDDERAVMRAREESVMSSIGVER